MNRDDVVSQVFVYGTLKGGEANHRLIMGLYDSMSLGRVCGTLYDLGAFPAAKFGTGKNCWIHGEMFRFGKNRIEDVLSLLDRLEGVPVLYNRRVVYVWNVVTKDDMGLAWSYEYVSEISPSQRIESGVWRKNMP